MAFIVDSDKINKLVLSPILIWIICQVHIGKLDVDFKIEFLHFWMYVLPLLVAVDQYSNWPIIEHAYDGSWKLMASQMNLLLMVDQSLQLVLISHFHFSAELGGDIHCLSSVALPHSNCSVEVAVKPAKRLITSNTGPNGSLDTDALERASQYCNTPDHQTGLHLQCISFWRTN